MAQTRVQPNDQGMFVCPECGREFPEAKGLGAHRRTHGVVGISASATRTRTKNAEKAAAASERPPNGPGRPVFAREAQGTTFPLGETQEEYVARVNAENRVENSTLIELARKVDEASIALSEAVQALQDHLYETYGPR